MKHLWFFGKEHLILLMLASQDTEVENGAMAEAMPEPAEVDSIEQLNNLVQLIGRVGTHFIIDMEVKSRDWSTYFVIERPDMIVDVEPTPARYGLRRQDNFYKTDKFTTSSFRISSQLRSAEPLSPREYELKLMAGYATSGRIYIPLDESVHFSLETPESDED